MRVLRSWTVIVVIAVLSACAQKTPSQPSAASPSNSSSASASELAGRYSGTEVLGGRPFPIWIVISPDGEIEITDVDGISVSGSLEGDRFYIERPNPYQVFQGSVSGDTVSGRTHGNTALGNGTFSATRN